MTTWTHEADDREAANISTGTYLRNPRSCLDETRAARVAAINLARRRLETSIPPNEPGLCGMRHSSSAGISGMQIATSPEWRKAYLLVAGTATRRRNARLAMMLNGTWHPRC